MALPVIWTDRLALMLAGFITFSIALMALLAGDIEEFPAWIFSWDYVKLIAATTLLPWLFLRFCVLVLRGPRRS